MRKVKTLKEKNRLQQLKKFQNKWVAFNEDRSKVVTSGESMLEVDEKLQKNKLKASVISFIFPFNASYSPYGKTKV